MSKLQKVIVYVTIDDCIRKREYTLRGTDKKVVKDGRITITFYDSWQNDHNGDWEDETINGWKTFELARESLLKWAKRQYDERVERIKSLVER